MKQNKTTEFEKTKQQIHSLHDEIDKLSKKNPNDAINKFKLGYVNEILTNANMILEEDYLPFKDFRTFSTEELPTNSDVVLILAQYIAAFMREYSDKKMWMQ